jgi:hypothetical protein
LHISWSQINWATQHQFYFYVVVVLTDKTHHFQLKSSFLLYAAQSRK